MAAATRKSISKSKTATPAAKPFTVNPSGSMFDEPNPIVERNIHGAVDLQQVMQNVSDVLEFVVEVGLDDLDDTDQLRNGRKLVIDTCTNALRTALAEKKREEARNG